MNKVFVFAFLALAAACASAPTEEVTPIEVMPTETAIPAHEQDKRAILYRTPAVGAGYYPAVGGYGYRYRYAPRSALDYLSYPSYPYYGGYAI